MDFCKFKNAVALQFKKMGNGGLFCTAVEKDDLWSTYLSGFPAGTNPMFRERTEHDCSCCRQFIRAVGNVVSIENGKVVTIWDGAVGDPTYQVVADAMAKLVRSKSIENEFLHTESTAGADKTLESIEEFVRSWDHFFVRLPAGVVARGELIGPQLSGTRALHDVLLRSINELSMDAVDTVLDLIKQNSLYRGSEHKFAVETFRKVKLEASELTDLDRDVFVWSKVKTMPGSVAKIRNTSIGQLLVDLSNGLELENAIGRFEAMVAPQNYKRATALVTPAMINKAKATIEELGLASALERRYARNTDVTVNNILFADRAARKALGGDVFDSIPTKKPSARKLDKVEDVTIEKFISDIVPNADSIEVMFENRHLNNLVSLIAPVDPAAVPLFKWDNGFSWSYNGDLADSIRERVKKAGGNVSGDLCCRLAWSNHDDLDFHMVEPDGHEIYFRNKGLQSRLGGMLDVDMNAGGGTTRTPVENIFYRSRTTMREGVYTLYVNNFSKRESVDVGFEVEIDWLGQVTRFAHEKAVRDKQKIMVAKLKYSKAKGIEIIESLPSTQASKTVWQLPTQDFHKVDLLMLSPNYWDGRGVGNKHYFFMMRGCQNDGQARGFFNEFLREELDQHRKVIEIVGSKMKAESSADQISGLGFSSTQRNEILAKVKGNFTRTVKVTF
ncbi:hypothetical protein [Bradyrhizobium ottawaense]|uniref:Uncharacterized protein n=1 Tax=Bradyrhizobium ottawaense TaxID=931866 RepID=A0ABY0QHD7_9BRAD|nr:hypothetical protein [Bradyrhizobium ottawaense]SDK44612.1 hypothetical protein SAMN05444163_8130 [Bradyrhizobium ottawaense]